MNLTFEKGTEDFILMVFDWHIGEDGYVRDENGQYAPVYERKRVKGDNIAGVFKDENGDPILVRDNFCDICDFVQDDSVGDWPEPTDS